MNDNLVSILEWLYPALKNFTDFTVQDDSDGRGKYIKHWNAVGIEKPSEAAVMVREAEWRVAIVAEKAAKEKAKAKQILKDSPDPPSVVVRAATAVEFSVLARVIAAMKSGKKADIDALPDLTKEVVERMIMDEIDGVAESAANTKKREQ